MPLPKGFIKNIKLTSNKIGPARRQEILDDIDNQGTFLPKGVLYEDMDKEFVDSISKDLEIVIDGEKVPVIFLTIQRWAEFSQTWQHSDEYKDIKLPFITIVRKPDVQVGTNQAGNWNEAGIKKYTYLKVPTFNGGRKGVDVYKIPQPTSVDLSYEVRLFCNKMRDLNKFNKITQTLFQSRQHYIYVNGHPMPTHLESVGDESPIDDFENRRFYVQLFEITLLGYLLYEDEFEIIPAVDRILVNEEIITSDVRPKIIRGEVKDGPQTINYFFLIKPRTNNRFKFTSEYDINFTELDKNNIESIRFKVNGSNVTVPFFVNAGDIVNVKFVKDFYETGDFTLMGTL